MKNKRFLIFLLLAAAVLFALTLSAFAESAPLTVYVGNTGSDGNSGTSSDKPVKTMTKAYQCLNTIMKNAGLAEDPSAEGRVVLTSNVAFVTSSAPNPGFDNHIYTIRVSGLAPDVQLQITKDYNHLGPTVYENITFKKLDSDAPSFMAAKGHALTIGENVTTLPSSTGVYLSILGSAKTGTLAGGTSVTVLSGTWRSIHAGTYSDGESGTSATVSGNASLTLKNCAVKGAVSANCGGVSSVTLAADEGKTLSVGGGELYADAFSGGGTLTLGSLARLTLGSVEGVSKFNLSGFPLSDTPYITAPGSTPDGAFVYEPQKTETAFTQTVGGKKQWLISVSEPLTIYLNGETGSDGNEGTSSNKPVQTLSKAYDLLNGLMADEGLLSDPDAAGNIVLTGNLDLTDSSGPAPSSFTSHVYTVAVSGVTPETEMRIKNDYKHIGPTKYENITFKQIYNSSSNHCFIVANGYPLTIGENVTTLPSSAGYYFTIIGAYRSGDYTGDTNVTVCSGTWRNVYAGAYLNNMKGDVRFTMTGGKITTVLSTSYNHKLTGNCYITINGAQVGKLCGANVNGTDKSNGNVEITVSNGAVANEIVGGGLNGVSGNITLSLCDCTVNGDVSAVCTGSSVINLSATEGHTLELHKGELAANAFSGGGTLAISQACRLTLSSVSGTSYFKILDTPNNKIPYITTPASTPDGAFVYIPQGDEILYTETVASQKKWLISGVEDPVGLFFKLPKNVKLTLYNGFKMSGDTVPASEITTEGDSAVYAFYRLPVGSYSYTCSGSGYYTVSKNFWYSAEKAAADHVVTDDPGKRIGSWFEPKNNVYVYRHTQEVIDNILLSSPSLWPGYEEVFETPYFADGHPATQATTQAEMMDFLRGLDGENDDMYLYIIGKTPSYDYDFPVVLFTKTDISSASSIEDAAALVAANGKATVYYQGQIHADEPSGGEGALALIKRLDGAYGESVLDKINICVVPRVNPDGSHDFIRKNINNDVDMNRDNMRLQSPEMEMVHSVYNLFKPEVSVDAHEFGSVSYLTSGALDDVQIGLAFNLNSTEAKNDLLMSTVAQCFTHTRDLGIRAFYYDCDGKTTSSANYSISKEYFGLAGSISFLIESNGHYSGLKWFARNVMSQYAVAEAIINFAAENEQTIRETVAEYRNGVAEKGAVYDENDLLIIEHGTNKNYIYAPRPTWNLTDGTSKNPEATNYMYHKDKAVRTRVRPTAYVIPRDAPGAYDAASLAEKHGIEYYEIDSGSAVSLQQYKGSSDEAILLSEQVVAFENGAYVFTMDRYCGNILAMLMEPDVTDMTGYNGTLVQSGIISPGGDGTIPIYRYAHDLKDGKITLEGHTHEYEYGICAICGEDSVAASLEGSVFTLSGELANGTRVMIAGYCGDRFVSAKEMIWQGAPVSFDAPLWERASVFFITDGKAPARRAVKVNG